MNYNYRGSVAERYMLFSATTTRVTEIKENPFDCLSIYVPLSIAPTCIQSGWYRPDEVTTDKPEVIVVDFSNYQKIFLGGLEDYGKIFRDGANQDTIIYLIVFNDTGFTPEITATDIKWKPLTNAFNKLYFISEWKTLYSPTNTTSDERFVDMSLCLAGLCSRENKFSTFISELNLVIPSITFDKTTPIETRLQNDPNDIKIMSLKKTEETTKCQSLTTLSDAERATYYWGCLNLVAEKNVWLFIQGGQAKEPSSKEPICARMLPYILSMYFAEKNSMGGYVGNKLRQIRLSDDEVKPTGLPSWINDEANENLEMCFYEILDDKRVGYFISINSSAINDVELTSQKTQTGLPAMAKMIVDKIDYDCAQKIAGMKTDIKTLTKPFFTSLSTYEKLKATIMLEINKYVTAGYLRDLDIVFPPYKDVKQGNWFVGMATWSAWYVDEIEGCSVSGNVYFEE